MVLADAEGTGRFTFSELTAGFYKLVETGFPDGYIQVDKDPVFEVRENLAKEILEIILLEMKQDRSVVDVDDNNNGVVRIENLSMIVGNTPGAALPNSGGSGTNKIYLLGIMLIGFACTGLVMRRRRKNGSELT